MNTMQRTIRGAVILTLAIILVGCNTPTAVVVAPTQDIPSIRTESAATVIAQITLDAALNPTATLAPTGTPQAATSTTAPTATTAATTAATNTPVPTFTPAVSSNTGSSSGTGGVIYPAATRRAGPDQAVLVDQTPHDGAVYQPGQEFDGDFVLKNIGTSTWTKDFIIRVTKDKGTNISKAQKPFFALPGTAKPGQTITAIADLVAPSTAGRYVTYWELCNANDDIFYTFYTVIDVK